MKQIICDFKLNDTACEKDNAETVTMIRNGVPFEADLCEDHQNAFLGNAHQAEEVPAPAAVTPMKRPYTRKATAAAAISNTVKANSMPYNVIRAWGQKNRFQVSDRGRPKQEVIDAWLTAGSPGA